MLPFHVVLHPTDFSEQANDAYQLARVIARESGARLIVLNVAGAQIDLPQVVHTDMGFAFDCSGDYQTRHAALKKQLHERFETDPGLRVETRLIYGPVAQEILRTADELGCDLIVMGTHGRSGLGRLMLGSVAEAVLGKARCPVLTVRSPSKAAPPAESNTRGREVSTA